MNSFIRLVVGCDLTFWANPQIQLYHLRKSTASMKSFEILKYLQFLCAQNALTARPALSLSPFFMTHEKSSLPLMVGFQLTRPERQGCKDLTLGSRES